MNLRIGAVALFAAASLTACASTTNGSVQPPKTSPNTAANSSTSQSNAASPTPTDSAPTDSAPTGSADGTAAYCAKLSGLSAQLGDLGSDTSDPTKAFDNAITYLNGLKDGAPANVAAALDDMTNLMQNAKKAYSDPAHIDTSVIAGLGTKLGTDAQIIGEYLATHCSGS